MITPLPSNIYYWWNFGSLLGFCLVIQILTGFFLRFYYENNIECSFDRINQIERNINRGWLIRSLHANGASLFFIFIYLHIGRGLYFKSFFIIPVWLTGVAILLLLFMIAFIGYVLPWGQIRFWGATVITNLVSSVPYVGSSLTVWLWGNFSVRKATLIRFFRLHFILPFFLIVLTFLHIIFLHLEGSRNPLGVNSGLDKIPFHPFFSWKDLLGYFLVFIFFFMFYVLLPYGLIDCDNFIPANSLVTPPHIQPEWYFLFAYAILRVIPNKLGGVVALLFSILVLVVLPVVRRFLHKKHTMREKLIKKVFFFFWLINFIFLTFIGAMPIEDPFILISTVNRLIYFLLFLIFI